MRVQYVTQACFLRLAQRLVTNALQGRILNKVRKCVCHVAQAHTLLQLGPRLLLFVHFVLSILTPLVVQVRAQTAFQARELPVKDLRNAPLEY